MYHQLHSNSISLNVTSFSILKPTFSRSAYRPNINKTTCLSSIPSSPQTCQQKWVHYLTRFGAPPQISKQSLMTHRIHPTLSIFISHSPLLQHPFPHTSKASTCSFKTICQIFHIQVANSNPRQANLLTHLQFHLTHRVHAPTHPTSSSLESASSSNHSP